jgi:D-lactate dehydrogenase (cytochrome)
MRHPASLGRRETGRYGIEEVLERKPIQGVRASAAGEYRHYQRRGEREGNMERSVRIEALSRRLLPLLGGRLITSESGRVHYGRDLSRLPAAPPDLVAQVESEEEACAVLLACHEAEVPIVPFGAGTSLEGHTLATRGGLSLDLSRMNRIKAVHPEDFLAIVEPGVTWRQLNRHLRDTGLFFPVDPGADSSIGGMASTRASGTNAVRYGTMRENVVAARVALADGEILKLGNRARKSSTGYDLTHLFIGSEGTLGVFTELMVRLHPIPETICAAVCTFETVAGAIGAVIEAMGSGLTPTRIEFLDALAIRMANAYSGLGLAVGPTLFVEFGGSASWVEEQACAFAEIAATHGGSDFAWSRDAAERDRLWRARHESLHATEAWKPGAQVWRTDVCVPISGLADAIVGAAEDLATSFIEGKILGHVGDGNFHIAYLTDPAVSAEAEEAERLTARLNRRAIKAGGTVSGEQGIGIAKLGYLAEEHGDAVLRAMHRIKLALDPKGLMNPAKMGSAPAACPAHALSKPSLSLPAPDSEGET